ncbi:pilus assembly protein TadG-related protein [Aeromicrobium marinum]|uniref:pilus assembly protein TadG-related protein n=1 Tax=Aeromicrobium marinum TaxID=219314 RepID=UPI0001BCD448|nr:pilus assembly protein TadG-related protein [Aeromicrobium marinum]
MSRLLRPSTIHEDRGATAIITAVIMTSLLSIGALTIDYGAASHVRRQTQNAADATTRSIVENCAKQAAAAGQNVLDGACVSATGTADASTIVQGNAPGSAPDAPVIGGAGREVSVTVAEPVDYRLAQLLGKDSDVVRSSATAEWTNLRPVEGFPVVPFGVAQCTYNDFRPSAGNVDGARTLIRSDVLQTVRSLVNNATGLLSGIAGFLRGILFPVNDLIGAITGSDAECGDGSANDVLAMQGGAWLTEAIDLDLVGASCDIDTRIGVLLYASSTLHDVLTSRCAARFGTQIRAGDTILLPIYRPKEVLTNVTGALGLSIQACGSGVSGNCVKVPPNLGAEIVGYAPFKVTGWRFGSNSSSDPLAPTCNNITISLPLQQLLSQLLLVGPLLNFVLGLLGFTVVEASVGCNGIQGYFTKSFTKDPNFEYAADGADFGAGLVRLKN